MTRESKTKQNISADTVPTVCEEAFSYIMRKKQGEYTIDDINALPEDYRAELIDGVIYDMSSPAPIHQELAGELYFLLKSYIRTNHGACRIYLSPLDVQLDCDDKTMVQPDLFIVCDRDKLKDSGIFGAPDFIIEVLSPSTRMKDLSIKLAKYQNAGVREYWIVDPEQEKVLVYDFTREVYPAIYGFTDKIPVGIYKGDCIVDFDMIQKYLHSIFHDKPETENIL